MSLQADWLAYLGDPTLFDRYHFSSLITDTEDQVDLDAAFSNIKNGNELISRIRRVIKENDFTGLYYIPHSDNQLDENSLIHISRLYSQSIVDRLESIGEKNHARLVSTNPLEVVPQADLDNVKKLYALEETDIFG